MNTLLLSAVVLICPQASVAAEKATQDIYRESIRSIVLVVAYDGLGAPSGLGSGFYIADDLVASNFHVIEDSSRISIKMIGEEALSPVISVPHASKTLDLAILKVERKGRALVIAGIESGVIGSKVVAIGNPRGLEGSVSEGIVSAIREDGALSILQITAPISPGSSGGPLFDFSGQVVGVTTATLKDSQNLNFAVPASYLTQLKTKGKTWDPPAKALDAPRIGTTGIELLQPLNDDLYNGRFVFSVRNATSHSVTDLVYVLLFRDRGSGKVLHYELMKEGKGLLPALAVRREVDVPSLRFWAVDGQNIYPTSPEVVKGYLKVDLRILSYKILDSNSPGKDLLDALK